MVPVVSTVLPGRMAGGLVAFGAISGERSSVMGAVEYWVWDGSRAVMTKVRERVPAGTMNSFSKVVAPVVRVGYSLTTLLKYSASVTTAPVMGTAESLWISNRSFRRLDPSSF